MLLLFALIIFNDETLLCVFLSEEQKPEQYVSHVIQEDIKENTESELGFIRLFISNWKRFL